MIKRVFYCRILETVEIVANQIPLEENQTVVVIPLTAFIVTVQEAQPKGLDYHEETLSALFGDDFEFDLEEIIDVDSLAFRRDPNATASITVPPNVFVNLSNISGMNETLRIAHTVFLTDVLFVRREEGSQEVGSIIISASIVGNFSLESIDPPIMLTFRKTPVSFCCIYKHWSDKLDIIAYSFFAVVSNSILLQLW